MYGKIGVETDLGIISNNFLVCVLNEIIWKNFSNLQVVQNCWSSLKGVPVWKSEERPEHLARPQLRLNLQYF